MKLRSYGDITLLEPDEPENPRADEPDHDDAEVDERLRMVLTPEEARTR